MTKYYVRDRADGFLIAIYHDFKSADLIVRKSGRQFYLSTDTVDCNKNIHEKSRQLALFDFEEI